MNMFNSDERYRGTGRTTRIKNFYVERLITEGFAVVYDHWLERQATENLVQMIKEDSDLQYFIGELNLLPDSNYKLKIVRPNKCFDHKVDSCMVLLEIVNDIEYGKFNKY